MLLGTGNACFFRYLGLTCRTTGCLKLEVDSGEDGCRFVSKQSVAIIYGWRAVCVSWEWRQVAAVAVGLAELWGLWCSLPLPLGGPHQSLLNCSPTSGPSFISHPLSPCVFFASNCELLGVPGPAWLCQASVTLHRTLHLDKLLGMSFCAVS